MKKPEEFDEAKEFETFTSLPGGNYICEIVDVKQEMSSRGNDLIAFSVEIAEGEYKGHFTRKYRGMKANLGYAVWGAKIFHGTSRNALPFLKASITAIEKSNPGFKWAWDDDNDRRVKGKKVLVQFQREEYKRGKWATRARRICSIGSNPEVLEDMHYQAQGGDIRTNSVIELVDEDNLPF